MAVMTEVFHGEGGEDRLLARMQTAKERGAALAVLPELPLDPWIAVYRQPRDRDAEAPGGWRHATLARCASETGVAILGGAVVRDPESGRRSNTALLVGAEGELIGEYRKLHLPEEEGYWETAHYEPGDRPPHVIDLDGFPVGIQICSDVNRPLGAQLLAASGAHALLAPRATPGETYDRWRLVLRAMAVTGSFYVISVNRPEEPGAPNGGPTLVVGPDGGVIAETTHPLVVVTLGSELVEAARQSYPGYLPYRPEVFSEGWKAVKEES